VQSVPATYPATLYRSTPIKRKACSIPLALLSMHSASSGKRRRLTSQVLPLLQDELHGRWYSYRNFLADFVPYGTWALSDTDDTLQLIAQYPSEHIQENLTHGSQDTTPTLRGLSWVSCRTSALRSLGKSQIRPDFVLTSNSVVPTWSTIVVVGEHHSVGKTEEAAKLQLASYVEQVFIAQPFRMAIIGILTSNSSTSLRFWRFDRAGAAAEVVLSGATAAAAAANTGATQISGNMPTGADGNTRSK
ncbi:hypothetical protein L211DRAFT_888657, partial [Terfezia boudieri ATCC MYA-4762]